MPDRWLDYEEAGALFGLSGEALRKRARRLGWHVRQPNEPGAKAQVLVPDGAELRPPAHPPGRPPGHRPEDLLAELRAQLEQAAARERGLIERAARAEGEAAALRGAVAHERAQAAAAREAQQAGEARERELAGELARQSERAGRAEADRDTQRERAGRAEAELAYWMGGGPFARALRVFLTRRGRP